MSLVAPQLNYAKEAVTNPSYRYNQLIQQTGGQQVILNTSSTTETIFEIPSKVYNLSRSILSCQVTVPQAPIGGDVIALHMEGMPVMDNISIYTRSGLFLARVDNVDKYLKTVQPRNNELKTLLYNDSQSSSPVTGSASVPGPLDSGYFFSKSDAIAGATSANFVANSECGFRVSPGGTSLQANDKDYSEQKHLMVGAPSGGGNAGNMNYYVQLPLSEIYDTLFAVDKDLYFGGEILLLRILWSPVNRMGWRSTPAGGLPTLPGVALDTGVVINNLRLDLAVEINNAIVAGMVEKVQSSGLSLVVPYVTTYKNSFASGTQSAISQKLNSGNGRTLLRVLTSAFTQNETGSSSQDNSNVASAKVIDFYSQLDSSRLQEPVINVLTNQDYLYKRKEIEDSSIQSSGQYKYSWNWCDSFDGFKSVQIPEVGSIENGLSLAEERLYQLNVTTNALALNFYSFYTTQKVLSIMGRNIEII